MNSSKGQPLHEVVKKSTNKWSYKKVNQRLV